LTTFRQFESNKKGIFGDQDYKLPFEEQGKFTKYQEDSMKKLHSLFFPISWREPTISAEILLMFS
jgi:hypothetical protein